MHKITSYIHRDLRKDSLLQEKAQYEQRIKMWQERIALAVEFTQNPTVNRAMSEVISEFRKTLAAYPTFSDIDIVSTEQSIWNFLSGYDCSLHSNDAIEEARRSYALLANSLSQINESLANIGDTDEREVTIQNIRAMFKPLSYIKNGSVNLWEDYSNHRYLRFTLCNTYVSSYESWSTSIESGLIPGAYKSVVPLDDYPSFLLSPLGVTVDLTSPNLSIKKTRANYQMLFDDSVHPHSSGPRNSCLGTFTNPYIYAVSNLDFISIASIIRMWAQIAVLSDGWGRSFLYGFSHILRTVLKNSNAYAMTNMSSEYLMWDNKPVYFHETAPGVYNVTVGEESYVYDPNQL